MGMEYIRIVSIRDQYQNFYAHADNETNKGSLNRKSSLSIRKDICAPKHIQYYHLSQPQDSQRLNRRSRAGLLDRLAEETASQHD
mmetsp:Transcript_15001/g.61099  ORF Transcript_15001/g.61099 Transcript_15001/m.61099 type:complete len:85 (-) Transcript_15001:1211-1465(-)